MKKRIYIQTLFDDKVILETPVENYENYKIYRKTKVDVPIVGFIKNNCLKVVFK